MIKLIRCDDRLIHGQCIVRVLGDFGIERIIGVDDFTADNPVLKRIYEMAVPPQIEGGIYTVRQAIALVSEQIGGAERTLVLLKSPQSALALFDAVSDLPKELNIGPMSSRKQTIRATMYAYLTHEEIEALDTMAGRGVRIYFNQTSDQRIEEWARVRSSMKL